MRQYPNVAMKPPGYVQYLYEIRIRIPHIMGQRRNTKALLSDFIETGQLITAGNNSVGRHVFL